MTESRPPWSPAGLLLGADVGGTSTRVGVATLDGELLTQVAGPAGNPNSVGPEVSALRIRTAAEQCLARIGASPELVRAAVIGLAGGARVDQAYLSSTLPPEVPGPLRLVSDLGVAFSSATPDREGYVLVAGTGAVAGRVVAGELLERRDGWGWLLGDEGSGFWLGREAVRATIRALQSGIEPVGQLAEAVIAQIGVRDPVSIVQLCYTRPPVWLAGFAALISSHAEDPVAAEIADRAAGLLVASLLDLDVRPGLQVVLAGSVATLPGPVRFALTERLAASLSNPVVTAASGVVGALWLAADAIGLTEVAIHERLARSVGRTTDALV